jgi:hypothetical protein
MKLRLVYIGMVLFLIYKTLSFSLKIWKGGNRFGAFGVALLALSHGVLMYWLIMDNRS